MTRNELARLGDLIAEADTIAADLTGPEIEDEL